MIGDLCKPINKGESNTIRITSYMPEMRELDRCATDSCAGSSSRD